MQKLCNRSLSNESQGLEDGLGLGVIGANENFRLMKFF